MNATNRISVLDSATRLLADVKDTYVRLTNFVYRNLQQLRVPGGTTTRAKPEQIVLRGEYDEQIQHFALASRENKFIVSAATSVMKLMFGFAMEC